MFSFFGKYDNTVVAVTSDRAFLLLVFDGLSILCTAECPPGTAVGHSGFSYYGNGLLHPVQRKMKFQSAVRCFQKKKHPRNE